MLCTTILAAFVLTGCSDDPTDLPTTGIIVINSSPDGTSFPWTLTIPDGQFVSGTSDTTLTEIIPGTYSITWDDIDGWLNKPAESSRTLVAGNTITFIGTYDNNFPQASTKDILMENFKSSYEKMIVSGIVDMMHQDYRTDIMQYVFDDWVNSDNPLTEMYFNYDQSVEIHQNLFGGFEGENESGFAVPPIGGITVSVLAQATDWALVSDGVPYYGGRGAYAATYNGLMHFYQSSETRFEMDQTFTFYIIQGDDELWSLLGIQGVPVGEPSHFNLATETIGYDGLLSLYR